MGMLERLQDPRFRWLLGLAICLVIALGISYFQTGDGLSRRILDRQFDLLHQRSAHPIQNDVVIVGIDEDSFRKFKEPFELWHPHLASFLQAMESAKPSVLGLDIALPERSYQFMLPHYEDGLVKALQALSAQTPVVLARKPDAEGALRPVDGALAASVADAPASVMLCLDGDGVLRRFDLNRCTVNAQGTSFAEKVAARLGVAHPGVGIVDFSAGQKFDYIPFSRVLEWQGQADKQRLVATFSGRTVLLGVVSARAEKVRVPVPMAVWSPMDKRVSEVLVQAQILRSMTGKGLIRELPLWGSVILVLAAALLWLGRTGWIKLAVFAVTPVALWLLATWMLGVGIYLPLGGILLSGLFAFMARLGYESVMQIRGREGLRELFDSYVNREALNGIMSGKIDSRTDGERVRVCLLHARIKDFSRRVQECEPQASVSLLNDYFSEMAIAVHQHKGTLDKFVGSELGAFFGAPQTLESPERNALEAAQEMLQRQREVNERLLESGMPAIEIEIALHVGQVVVGHVGSSARKDYTALGSEIDVVKALVELAKSAGCPVVCSAEVAEVVRVAGGISEVGIRQVGGADLHVYAWTPPLLGGQ
ncbi:MAG: adenylate/guanylate cyclase domain-containing protein [Sideroxydans sp.]|nr:adenylate/guanylate cyclase domain-containing protein [Sideroxydans sp.]